MLDGHHLVENRARVGRGLALQLLGTGGIWRKVAIETSGGWQHDTITEDLDLSLPRAARGLEVRLPEERGDAGRAPRGRQRVPRAAVPLGQGDGAVPRKLMKRIMTADLTVSQRIEAFFHMTPHFAYPLMVFLSLLLLPALILMPATNPRTMLLIDLPLVRRDDGLSRRVLRDGRGRPGAQAKRRPPAAPRAARARRGAGAPPHEGRDRGALLHGRRVRPHPEEGDQGSALPRQRRPPARRDRPLPLLVRERRGVRRDGATGSRPPSRCSSRSGYGYVATLVASEQFAGRRAADTDTATASDGATARQPATA